MYKFIFFGLSSQNTSCTRRKNLNLKLFLLSSVQSLVFFVLAQNVILNLQFDLFGFSWVQLGSVGLGLVGSGCVLLIPDVSGCFQMCSVVSSCVRLVLVGSGWASFGPVDSIWV